MGISSKMQRGNIKPVYPMFNIVEVGAQIYGLSQNCSISIADALEILQSCPQPT